MGKYYTVYETKNELNGMKYIGCHITNDLDDGYLGSGSYLRRAIDKYGEENFTKKIIKICENQEEMIKLEEELVDINIIKSEKYYNICLGGGSNWSHINENLEYYRKYFKSKVVVQNGDDKISIDRNDDRWVNGELEAWNKGFFLAKDKEGLVYHINREDERWVRGDLSAMNKGKVMVKDNNGHVFLVEKGDDRLDSGELIYFWKGRKHKEETKKKIGEKNSIHQKGKGNSQYGTCWVHNEELKENRKIKKEELDNWIKNKWKRGRKMKW